MCVFVCARARGANATEDSVCIDVVILRREVSGGQAVVSCLWVMPVVLLVVVKSVMYIQTQYSFTWNGCTRSGLFIGWCTGSHLNCTYLIVYEV